MIGLNEMMLNQATVIEALQEYFDRRTIPRSEFGKIILIQYRGYDAVITITGKENGNEA